MKAYCVKCQAKRELVGGESATLKNGRQAIKGKCGDCGSGMFKILGGTEEKAKTVPHTASPKASAFRFTFFDQ